VNNCLETNWGLTSLIMNRGRKIRDYGTVSRLMFAKTTGIAEANVWNSNPPPRGSDYGVAAIGILMSSTLDSHPEAAGAWGDKNHSCITAAGRVPSSKISCHAVTHQWWSEL
jgi:hypothetical protein